MKKKVESCPTLYESFEKFSCNLIFDNIIMVEACLLKFPTFSFFFFVDSFLFFKCFKVRFLDFCDLCFVIFDISLLNHLNQSIDAVVLMFL